MKQKIFLSFFSCLLLFFSCTPSFVQAEENKKSLYLEIIRQEIRLLQSLISNINSSEEISSASYLAISIDGEEIYAKKDSDSVYPIASITKLMTAVVVKENIPGEETIIITPQMRQAYGNSPSIFNGLEISAKNLLKATLVQSTNTAAEALSCFKVKENFVFLMNQKAKEIGMQDTFFHDAHGLSPLNRSTTKDIAKLTQYIYENHPEILKTTKNNDFWLPNEEGSLLKFRNLNNFYPFPGFLGGKTGYLHISKQTFAGIFNIKNEPVILVVLKSENRQADIFSLIRKVRDKEVI